jgi:hypothetical protein
MVSFARQRRIRALRAKMLQEIGEEIRQGTVPEAARSLAAQCDRCDEEIRQLRTASSHGWLTRFWLRMRLLMAEGGRRHALLKFGEAGITMASPARQKCVRDLEGAIAREQALRLRLWETWRKVDLRHRTEIVGGAALLLIAAIFLSAHFLRANLKEQSEVGLADQPGLVSDEAAAEAKKRKELPKQFVKDRKETSPGDWFVYTGNPVLQRGELDQWDDFKVGTPVVVKEFNRFRMWYRACHFVMREYTCGIGHATSEDGVSWTKSPGPVFTPESSHERERLDSLAIVRAGDQYWMWYSVRPDQFNGFPYATIDLATSKDGLAWRSAGPVLRALSEYTGSLEPSGYYDGKVFHLWYTDYPSDEEPAILHVTSADGKQWQTAGSTALSSLKTEPGRLSMLSDGQAGYRAFFAYSGRERGAGVFEVLLSSDGNQWRRADVPKLAFRDAAQAGGGLVLAPSVVRAEDGLWVWYTLRPRDGAEKISLAFLKEKAS